MKKNLIKSLFLCSAFLATAIANQVEAEEVKPNP